VSYAKGRNVGVGRRKRPPCFPGARSTRPHSDPDEAVNESGGRWLKHRLSPMNGKSEKSDRRDIQGLAKPRFRLTGEGVCRRNCMHSLTEKTQVPWKLEHASVGRNF
jgi:hypothetical protein